MIWFIISMNPAASFTARNRFRSCSITVSGEDEYREVRLDMKNQRAIESLLSVCAQVTATVQEHELAVWGQGADPAGVSVIGGLHLLAGRRACPDLRLSPSPQPGESDPPAVNLVVENRRRLLPQHQRGEFNFPRAVVKVQPKPLLPAARVLLPVNHQTSIRQRIHVPKRRIGGQLSRDTRLLAIDVVETLRTPVHHVSIQSRDTGR